MSVLAIDLFCGAGGASMGLARAGFDVRGVDIKPQPHYPFAFTQGDALLADLSGADFVWASPPCQAHSALKFRWKDRKHEDLIPATRAKLRAWGGPYIIENVMGAPLQCPVLLCGTMFGLGTGDAELRRHRLFESNVVLWVPRRCAHGGRSRVIGVYGGHGHDRRSCVRAGTNQFSIAARREAMGIDGMNGAELSQAIPPAYSEWLGAQILRHLSTLLEANEPTTGGGDGTA